MSSIFALCLTACGSTEAADKTSGDLSAWTESQSSGSPTDLADPVDVIIRGSDVKAEPSPDAKSYYLSLTNYLLSVSECMSEKGYPNQGVEDPNTPFVTMNIAGFEGQEDAYIHDIRGCWKATEPEPTPPTATREQAQQDYQQALQFVECVKVEGYSFDALPSEQEYVDSYLGDGGAWNPQVELIETQQIQPHQLKDLHGKCPLW